ncbi:hypothetical protein EV421DRAFT_1749815 [Armillaria borealis]|uniref:Ion transport domain-containing protein n=1 Tax=Armillaria borealis TaxID=47425 RepID=A0AA39K7H4_9AGAR|nr:hypothetical protein EV421DRAFT_1749815 [Armillaria borealis]
MSPPTDIQDDIEYEENDSFNRDADDVNTPLRPEPTRSIYALTRQEITKGLANRFVHSRTYIILYLGMAALRVSGLPFYILEIIINVAMILEVGVRFVAFGRQFWKSPFNVVDLILTVFCALTLLVLAFASSCGSTSKEEEILDTLLLVARNVLQFSRLAAVMRQSGQSIFSRPKPIDINAARRYNLDIDIDSDEEEDTELGRPLVRNPVLFDAGSGQRPQGSNSAMSAMPRAAEAARDRDTEDVWAELG